MSTFGVRADIRLVSVTFAFDQDQTCVSASASNRIDRRATCGAEIKQKENPGLAGAQIKYSNRDVWSLFPSSQRIRVRE